MQADGAPVRLSKRNRTGAYSICDRREPGRPKNRGGYRQPKRSGSLSLFKNRFHRSRTDRDAGRAGLSFFHLYPKRKAEVVPYKPEWKGMFEREKADLIRIFYQHFILSATSAAPLSRGWPPNPSSIYWRRLKIFRTLTDSVRSWKHSAMRRKGKTG